VLSLLPLAISKRAHRFRFSQTPRQVRKAEVRPALLGLMEVEKKPAHRPSLRVASLEDYPQIASLESRYGLETKTAEEWKHLWINNPVYAQLQGDWPIGWVLESGDGHIVGYLGNIPLGYQFQGRRLVAAATYAWVVDSPYRSYSILLLDRYFDQTRADLFLSTTVNCQASKAFCSFNSLPVPVGAWDRSAFWITDHRGFAASWMAMRVPALGGLLSYPLSAALWSTDLLARRALGGGRKQVEVECCADFDSRFDTFWEVLKTRSSHLLLGVRTREVLGWHFKYAILRKAVWILTVTEASELVAYSIFCRQDSLRFGLKRMRLVDFQALDGSRALLLPMLSWALAQCRQEGIHMLEHLGFCPQRDVFANLRPRQRKLPSWLYFYKARDQSLGGSLASPEVWDPSWFDGDSSL